MIAKATTFLERFRAEVHSPDAYPEKLALYIAGMAYPDLNIDNQIHILNRISEGMAKSLENSLPGEQRALRFLSVFNYEFEFEGNRTNYNDVRNSFLNDVLERRVGLPISLGVICMAIGRRLREMGYDITIEGLGLPSHFMTRYEDEAGVWLLDPFNGVIILPHEAGGYLSRMFDSQWTGGGGVTLPPEVFRPITTNMVAFRILNNLRIIFLHEENLLSAIQVLDYMLALAPNDAALWRERGLLNYQCENWERAERDLRRHFFLNGNLIATMASADFELGMGISLEESAPLGGLDDMDDGYFEIQNDLSDEEQNLLYILGDIEQIRVRLN